MWSAPSDCYRDYFGKDYLDEYSGYFTREREVEEVDQILSIGQKQHGECGAFRVKWLSRGARRGTWIKDQAKQNGVVDVDLGPSLLGVSRYLCLDSLPD